VIFSSFPGTACPNNPEERLDPNMEDNIKTLKFVFAKIRLAIK